MSIKFNEEFYLTHCVDQVDPYAVLGLRNDATPEQIKLHYQFLIRHFHPDKNKHPNANEISQKIGRAFNILKDPQKMSEYHVAELCSTLHELSENNYWLGLACRIGILVVGTILIVGKVTRSCVSYGYNMLNVFDQAFEDTFDIPQHDID